MSVQQHAQDKPTFARPAFATCLALLVCSAIGLSLGIAKYKIMLRKLPIYPKDGRQLLAMPSQTEHWTRIGPDRRENAETEKTLGTSNYVSRVYTPIVQPDPANPIAVDFHAAYYTGMIDTVPHVPDRCFVGGGMQIGAILGELPMPIETRDWRPDDEVPAARKGQVYKVRLSNKSERAGSYVRLPFNPQSVMLRTMEFKGKDGRPLYAGYFFIANGGMVARAEGVRLLAFDLKTKYAYYCKVQFTSSSCNSAEEFVKASASLLDDLFGEVMLCLPDWVEVETSPPEPDPQGS